MKDFMQSLPFMISFLITTLFINMSFGQKMAQSFLVLVLLSMVIVNADEVSDFIKKVNSTNE